MSWRQVTIVDRVSPSSLRSKPSLYGGTPDLVRRMRARWPNLQIEILEMMSSKQITALKEGRIDLGFGRVRLTDPAIARVRLREESLVLALPAEHPLASLSDPVALVGPD